MEKRFEKCNKCKYREIEDIQHMLMLGIDTERAMHAHYSEDEYESLRYHLEEYAEDSYFKDAEGACDNFCSNCKSKVRVEKFKVYLNKMIKILNCDRYYYIEKLQRIYFLQDDYFEECDDL